MVTQFNPAMAATMQQLLAMSKPNARQLEEKKAKDVKAQDDQDAKTEEKGDKKAKDGEKAEKSEGMDPKEVAIQGRMKELELQMNMVELKLKNLQTEYQRLIQNLTQQKAEAGLGLGTRLASLQAEITEQTNQLTTLQSSMIALMRQSANYQQEKALKAGGGDAKSQNPLMEQMDLMALQALQNNLIQRGAPKAPQAA